MSTRMPRSVPVLLASAGLVAALLAGCGDSAAPSASPAPPPTSGAAMAGATPTPDPTPARSAAATPRATPTTAPPEPWPVPADAALPEDTAARLAARLESLVEASAATGAVAAIVTPDGTWAGATGVDGAGNPIEPTSAFGIGSVSKTMTAAEILLLASQGKLDLDAPVTDYVDLPFDARGATIRQLAMMQSGFPAGNDANLETLVAKDPGRTWTVDDVLDWAKDTPRAGTLGGPGMYNGINYQALSKVVETVTGTSLAEAFRRDLLGPAGLERMWTQAGEQPEAPLAIARDPGSGIVDATSGWLPSLAAASTGNGAAGLAADAPTLARWAYLLYGSRVIPPELVAVMTKPNWASQMGYGFGTMFDKASGTLVVGHAGDYMGYSAVMLAWPEQRVALAVLVPREGMSSSGEVPDMGFELYRTLVAGS